MYLKRQCGVVLFIALMALVVMSIAAVALIRSVDTNTTIAGNLSFQQSALVSADRGVESAIAWIQNQVAIPGALNNDITAGSGNAYFAIYGNVGPTNLDLDDRADLKADATWVNSALATGTGITGGIEDDSQNQINYIIERMCTDRSPPVATGPGQKCLLGASKNNGDSLVVEDSEGGESTPGSGFSVVYRVTVRVNGPKNTQSYSQIYVY